MTSLKEKINHAKNGLAGLLLPSYLGFEALKLSGYEHERESLIDRPLDSKDIHPLSKNGVILSFVLDLGCYIPVYKCISDLHEVYSDASNYSNSSTLPALATLGLIGIVRAASGVVLSNTISKTKEQVDSARSWQ